MMSLGTFDSGLLEDKGKRNKACHQFVVLHLSFTRCSRAEGHLEFGRYNKFGFIHAV